MMDDLTKIGRIKISGLVKVVEGRSSQGSVAYRDYAAPNGTKLRVLNPDIKKEANRRANAILNGLIAPD